MQKWKRRKDGILLAMTILIGLGIGVGFFFAVFSGLIPWEGSLTFGLTLMLSSIGMILPRFIVWLIFRYMELMLLFAKKMSNDNNAQKEFDDED